MISKQILKRQLTALLTNRDMSTVITALREKIQTPITIPTSIPDAKAALRKAQRTCRLVAVKARDLAKQHQETRIIAKQLANPDKDPDSIAKAVRDKRDVV